MQLEISLNDYEELLDCHQCNTDKCIAQRFFPKMTVDQCPLDCSAGKCTLKGAPINCPLGVCIVEKVLEYNNVPMRNFVTYFMNTKLFVIIVGMTSVTNLTLNM